MEEKIIHKELSYLINGCIFDVRNEIGPGVREECYQKAVEYRFAQSDIPFVPKPRTRTEFHYRGTVVDVFEPDLLVPERMIVELKHQPEGLARDNFTQVLTYLKFWNLRLGLLVNFAMDKAIIERVPCEPRECETEEDYDYIRDQICDEHRPILQAVRKSLLEINQRIGIGYAATTYRNLAIVEFRAHGLKCESDIEVTPVFRERRLPTSRISPLVVEGRICVQIEAIYDEITARAIRTMQTHLRMTGGDLGLVACFGKTKFLIRGVRK
ncbi:MAG: GxxExxY protein [Planctomycetes bacterium]|nr:GxxExxY protein [Planctomycetota bacterium]MBL7043670.1 GxxExxY protein [Pirellulaceae bacterium]